jgi:hypothetical protein
LATREQRRGRCWLNLESLFQVHVNSLTAQELHASPSMLPPTPVTPEERLTPDNERVQQDAHLARFRRGAALPLTLLAQWARAATTDAGSIHHAQAAVSFSTPLLDRQRLPCWTPQGPIRLECKVLSREATRFPGSGGDGWTISGCGRR